MTLPAALRPAAPDAEHRLQHAHCLRLDAVAVTVGQRNILGFQWATAFPQECLAMSYCLASRNVSDKGHMQNDLPSPAASAAPAIGLCTPPRRARHVIAHWRRLGAQLLEVVCAKVPGLVHHLQGKPRYGNLASSHMLVGSVALPVGGCLGVTMAHHRKSACHCFSNLQPGIPCKCQMRPGNVGANNSEKRAPWGAASQSCLP